MTRRMGRAATLDGPDAGKVSRSRGKGVFDDAAVLVGARREARQARRTRLRRRPARHRRARARHHQARVRDRPGQLPQQGRPGLQGQRRLPGPVRRPGDAHRHHHGRGPHRRRAVHGRRPRPAHEAPRRAGRRPARCTASSPRSRSLEFADTLVPSPDGNPTTSIAGGALQNALTQEKPGTPEQAARLADATTTLDAPQRGARRPSAPSTTRSGSSSCSTTTRATSASRTGRSSSTTRTRRSSCACRATSRSNTRAPPPTWCVDAGREALDSRTRPIVTTGAPILLKDINDYLRGGMLTLGGIAVAIMVVILLVLFNVRWRLCRCS